MTPKRWFLFVVACLVMLIIGSALYFRTIKMPIWLEETKALEAAMDAGNLTSVHAINKHVWESVTWIAEGLNEMGASVYVFQNEKGETLHTIQTNEVLAVDEIMKGFKAGNAGAKVIRISPGRFRNSPAWEIDYSISQDGVKRFYIQFLSFDRLATPIETYKLPLKTGP